MSQLKGDKALKQALKQHRVKLTQKMQLALRAGAMEIQNSAKKKVPVKTGNLKRSINTEIEENGDEINAIIGTDVEYAPYIEYGTRPHKINAPVEIKNVGWRYIGKHPGTEPKPFLRPAFDENEKKANEIIDKTLDKLLRKL